MIEYHLSEDLSMNLNLFDVSIGSYNDMGPSQYKKNIFPGMGISMLKIRLSLYIGNPYTGEMASLC